MAKTTSGQPNTYTVSHPAEAGRQVKVKVFGVWSPWQVQAAADKAYRQAGKITSATVQLQLDASTLK